MTVLKYSLYIKKSTDSQCVDLNLLNVFSDIKTGRNPWHKCSCIWLCECTEQSVLSSSDDVKT